MMSPSLASSWPAIMRKVVVLPQPLGPSRYAQVDRIHRHGLAEALGQGHQFDVGLSRHRFPQSKPHASTVELHGDSANAAGGAPLEWRAPSHDMTEPWRGSCSRVAKRKG